MGDIEDRIGPRHVRRKDRARLLRRERLAGDEEADPPRPWERDARRDRPAVARERDGECTVQCRRHIVGMPFDLARDPQQGSAIERAAHERVGRHDSADDRGRARSETASDRDRRALSDVIGAKRLGGRFRGGARGYDEEVVVPGRNAVAVLVCAVAVDVHRPRAGGPEIEFRE